METQVANGKAGVIAGSDVALAVDAGIDDAEGEAVLAAARSMDRSEIRLVYTHGHIDHALGGTAFRGVPIHARTEVTDYMRSQLAGWADRQGESLEHLDDTLGWPTERFTAEVSLDLGGRTVRFIDTPGHAPGSVCVFDPDTGVLFGGDTIVTAIPPAFSDGDGVVLAATLRTLAILDAETLIPGHGEIVHGRAAVREAIEWAADYLERCHAHVEATAGQDEAAIVSSAPYDEYIGDRLSRDRHRMELRHENTLRTLMAQRQVGADGPPDGRTAAG